MSDLGWSSQHHQTSLSAIFRMAMAAACMARGLTARETEEVHVLLAPQEVAGTIRGTYEQLERAIEEVKGRRE